MLVESIDGTFFSTPSVGIFVCMRHPGLKKRFSCTAPGEEPIICRRTRVRFPPSPPRKPTPLNRLLEWRWFAFKPFSRAGFDKIFEVQRALLRMGFAGSAFL